MEYALSRLYWRLLKATSEPPLRAPVHAHRLSTFHDHLQRIINRIAAQRHLFHANRHTFVEAFTSIYYLAVAAELGQIFWTLVITSTPFY